MNPPFDFSTSLSEISTDQNLISSDNEIISSPPLAMEDMSFTHYLKSSKATTTLSKEMDMATITSTTNTTATTANTDNNSNNNNDNNDNNNNTVCTINNFLKKGDINIMYSKTLNTSNLKIV